MYITEFFKSKVAEIVVRLLYSTLSSLPESIPFHSLTQHRTAWQIMSSIMHHVDNSEDHHGLIARRDAIALITTMTKLGPESIYK